MKTALILLVALLSGCDYVCNSYGKVTALGECAYSKYGDYGSTECSALTEHGVKVTSGSPFVVGEQACESHSFIK